MNGYTLSSELGNGGQGRVYKADYNGVSVAIKQYSRRSTAYHEYDVIMPDPPTIIIMFFDL